MPYNLVRRFQDRLEKLTPPKKKVLVFSVKIMYFNFSFRAELPFGRLTVKIIKVKNENSISSSSCS